MMAEPALSTNAMHALRWAAMGFPVFPVFEMSNGKCSCGDDCKSPGKHPRIERWTINATIEDDKIRNWWTRWPHANIGICCGPMGDGHNLLVVDIDPRHDGDVTFAKLEQRNGVLPETPRNLTGGGGQHIFFRTRRKVRSRANALGPGVDVKCMGGYVLAPPSNHNSGGTYQRDAGADFDDLPLAEAPEWLVALADPPEVSSKEAPHGADAFIEGGRHNALVSVAGALRRKGLTPAEILPSLNAVNEYRCKPPLDDKEIKSIAYSANWKPQDPVSGSDPWNLMTAEQIFAQLPEYPWLIPGLHIAPGRVTLLAGYADVGKTVIAMSISLAMASGSAVWGVYRPARAGKVLHLNGEIGKYLAQERYQRLARGMDLNERELVASGNLVLSNFPAVQLDDKDCEQKFILACTGYDLCIIDSLRAFSGAMNEKETQTGRALLMLARVSEATGTTFIVLHHNRKPSKDDIGGAKMAISGSGSIFGSCECAYVFSAASKGGPILVEHERSPIGVKLQDFGLKFEDVGSANQSRWGLRIVHLEKEQLDQAAEASKTAQDSAYDLKTAQAIFDTLNRYAGHFRGSVDSLRLECRIAKNQVSRVLEKLIREGAIEKAGTYHSPEYIIGTQYGSSTNRYR